MYGEMAGNDYLSFSPFKWTINSHKIPSTMNPYDGAIEHYDSWYDRFRNHAANANPDWVKVLDLIQATKSPITRASIAGIAANPQWKWTV